MSERPHAEYAERNAEPILEVLRREFRDCTRVLEIGSGTGQHAVRFASELDHVSWQTSDLDENHAGIRAWIAESGLRNVHDPISLDVMTADLQAATFDGVYSSNTAHIMGFDAVVRMFTVIGKALRANGVFCLYGPFRKDGEFNTESNAMFDASLRARDAVMGIRDLEALDRLATEQSMRRTGLYAVPSNNLVAVWQKVVSNDNT